MKHTTAKPQKPQQEKITLKFMDVSVTMTGNKDVEQKAISLLSYMIQDRMRIMEVMADINHEDDEPSDTPRTKKVQPELNNEYLKGYS